MTVFHRFRNGEHETFEDWNHEMWKPNDYLAAKNHLNDAQVFLRRNGDNSNWDRLQPEDIPEHIKIQLLLLDHNVKNF